MLLAQVGHFALRNLPIEISANLDTGPYDQGRLHRGGGLEGQLRRGAEGARSALKCKKIL